MKGKQIISSSMVISHSPNLIKNPQNCLEAKEQYVKEKEKYTENRDKAAPKCVRLHYEQNVYPILSVTTNYRVGYKTPDKLSFSESHHKDRRIWQ